MKDYFKYDEIKEYFDDFVAENSEALQEHDFRYELHYHAFNTNYYIVGAYQATQWLEDQTFNVINIIKDYEQSNFGQVTTDLSEPEKVVNMYVYIIGQDIVSDWLDANPIKEEETEEV